MSSVITHLLVSSCDITRNDQPTDNGQGGWVPAPRVVFSSLACRLVGLTVQEKLLEAQRQSFSTNALFVEAGTAIQLEDTVVVDGSNYRVMGQNTPSLPYFDKWMLQEVQRAGE